LGSFHFNVTVPISLSDGSSECKLATSASQLKQDFYTKHKNLGIAMQLLYPLMLGNYSVPDLTAGTETTKASFRLFHSKTISPNSSDILNKDFPLSRQRINNEIDASIKILNDLPSIFGAPGKSKLEKENAIKSLKKIINAMDLHRIPDRDVLMTKINTLIPLHTVNKHVEFGKIILEINNVLVEEKKYVDEYKLVYGDKNIINKFSYKYLNIKTNGIGSDFRRTNGCLGFEFRMMDYSSIECAREIFSIIFLLHNYLLSDYNSSNVVAFDQTCNPYNNAIVNNEILNVLSNGNDNIVSKEYIDVLTKCLGLDIPKEIAYNNYQLLDLIYLELCEVSADNNIKKILKGSIKTHLTKFAVV
jgi:hypothetical protein